MPATTETDQESLLKPGSIDAIVVRGARAHNLKNISVTIPRNSLCVLTGPSGSGKSSLAFDTIYAEGQRRYVESLSAYARQFLEQVEKVEIESIEGLSPTISIEQKTTSHNPRSTVGTVTELNDYLRVLFARISKPYCWKCNKLIRSQSPQQIVDVILDLKEGTKCSILSPIVRERKGEYQKELISLRQKGFVRVRIDGETLDLSDDIKIDKNKKHTIDVYVDRIIIKSDKQSYMARVSESVDLALKLSEGLMVLETQAPETSGDGGRTETLFSEKFSCPDCNISYPPPEPRTFSFNSPLGACGRCDGLGFEKPADEDALEESEETESQHALNKATPCADCNGSRLRIESRHYKLNGQSISDVTDLSLHQCLKFFETIKLTDRESKIVDRIIKDLKDRLGFLLHVGVEYLTLSRPVQTLSGGESQRIRLATQIGSALTGVIYVLDEPSIGLHQRDNDKLLETLETLRDQGNTVLVVEHDQDTMRRADWIVDLGPGAGVEGGFVVAEGPLQNILNSKRSVTGQYLSGELRIEVPKVRRPIERSRQITLAGITENNLKSITVNFPLGVFTCVTGVSGSGKSSLVIDTLYRTLVKHLLESKVGEIKVKLVTGLEHIDKVVDIDQSPIGRTPRSNSATYTGVMSIVRELFSNLPEAKIRGYSAGRFSFNVKGGRCETCEGAGTIKIEMHFMPDVYVKCKDCNGSRFNNETLQIRYKGKNIHDVLSMSSAEAHEFFTAIPAIKAKMSVICDVGLGYIQLGQSSTTLSGGEAQRIKLATELSRRATGRTLYILDEPSTGLHFDDIQKLLKILQSLVNSGNTVIVIEHNLDIIKVADHIIDVGPEAGEKGGEIVAEGTPEDVAKSKISATAQYLRHYLNKK